MSNQLTSIDFNSQTILTAQQNGIIYTAIKPICENIGLAWNAQLERINRDEVLNSTVRMIRMVANDGKNREMLCLPIHHLNGWLFGVDTNRVKAEIKDKLITYKKECYQALFDYWNNGVAVNPRATKDERKPLVQAVNMFVTETGAIYSNVWKMIHQRFDVGCVDELTGEQVHQAVEYVHGLMLKVKENPDNAFWRMVGVLEYDRISRELRNLQSTLDTAQRQLNHITKTKGLLYDAFGEQRHISHDPNIVANAQAFIDRQMAMKTRFL